MSVAPAPYPPLPQLVGPERVESPKCRLLRHLAQLGRGEHFQPWHRIGIVEQAQTGSHSQTSSEEGGYVSL